jgi:hypothetical protein
MTTGHHDLWGHRLEWENDHDPGTVLDWWRETEAMLEPFGKLGEFSPNEALGTAWGDTIWRVRAEISRWEEEVRMRLEWNKAHGKLTPFGRVLKPLMERAGFTGEAAPRELLHAAGRLEEPHAIEVLERRMYGLATTDNRTLMGLDAPLGIGEKERKRLAVTLFDVGDSGSAERVAAEAEAEYRGEGGR